jgi:predicted amidohydrolase YtcJ
MHFVAARLTAYIVALIVGITFIAGLIVGAQRPDDGPVDLMVVNGRVYTADGEGTTAEAVAIQGNKILRVGTTREIQRLRRAQTVVIDAKGGAVLPGFTQTDARLFDDADEAAPAPVYGPHPPPTRGEELAALRQAMSDAHRRGITSVQPLGGAPHELDIYEELRRENALSLRVYVALAVPADSSELDLDSLDELRAKFPDDPLLKAGAAEIAVDGDEVAPETLNELVAALDRRNWQIVIHADGDRALDMALDAYKHAIAVNPIPARGRRHRVETAEIMGPVDFEPFDELGISYPSPRQAPSMFDTIDAHTRNAAWMSFDEQRKGALVPDMLADVIVLSKNILSLPAARFADAEVRVTIFDGKVVFQRTNDTDY